MTIPVIGSIIEPILKYMTVPVIIAFVGAILSALGAILSSMEQAKESKENADLNKQIASLAIESKNLAIENKNVAEESKNAAIESKNVALENYELYKQLNVKSKEIEELQRRLNDKQELQIQKTEQIAKLNAELAESQKEIALLNKDVRSYVTGGDSYCFITIRPTADTSKLRIEAFQVGKYPLNITEIFISNSSRVDRIAGNNGPMRRSMGMFWRYGTPTFRDVHIPSSSYNGKLLGEIEKPKDWLPHDSFHIEFRATNGIWTQQFQRTVNNEIIRVMKEGKVILERGTSD